MPNRAIKKTTHRARENAAQRGYDRKWRTARAAYLATHPLCVDCEHAGLVVAATVVDHVQPHRGNHGLFWDPSNWQPLCKQHHDAKTARETGFGSSTA